MGVLQTEHWVKSVPEQVEQAGSQGWHWLLPSRNFSAAQDEHWLLPGPEQARQSAWQLWQVLSEACQYLCGEVKPEQTRLHSVEFWRV